MLCFSILYWSILQCINISFFFIPYVLSVNNHSSAKQSVRRRMRGGGTVTSNRGVHEDVSARTGGTKQRLERQKGSEDCCGFKGTFWATR